MDHKYHQQRAAKYLQLSFGTRLCHVSARIKLKRLQCSRTLPCRHSRRAGRPWRVRWRKPRPGGCRAGRARQCCAQRPRQRAALPPLRQEPAPPPRRGPVFLPTISQTGVLFPPPSRLRFPIHDGATRRLGKRLHLGSSSRGRLLKGVFPQAGLRVTPKQRLTPRSAPPALAERAGWGKAALPARTSGGSPALRLPSRWPAGAGRTRMQLLSWQRSAWFLCVPQARCWPPARPPRHVAGGGGLRDSAGRWGSGGWRPGEPRAGGDRAAAGRAGSAASQALRAGPRPEGGGGAGAASLDAESNPSGLGPPGDPSGRAWGAVGASRAAEGWRRDAGSGQL